MLGLTISMCLVGLWKREVKVKGDLSIQVDAGATYQASEKRGLRWRQKLVALFGLVNLELPIRHVQRHTKQIIGYMSLDLRGIVWAEDVHILGMSEYGLQPRL